MCRELDDLRQSIKAYAGDFDAQGLLPAQAARVVHTCAQMEASIASLKALAAARAAEGNRWRDEGYRSPADHLAHDTGVSAATAKRTLETGKRLAQQPDVAAAALAGRLSAQQTEAVSDGVAANPARAKELIEKAQHSSLTELNEEVARTKAAMIDQEVRRQSIHAKRSLRRWTDRDGALQAHLYGNPEDGINLWRMLDPIRRRLIILRRESAPHQPLDAVDFDALMSVAAIAGGQDGELTLADLLELGLFPQLDATPGPSRTVPGGDLAPDSPAPPSTASPPPCPAPPRPPAPPPSLPAPLSAAPAPTPPAAPARTLDPPSARAVSPVIDAMSGRKRRRGKRLAGSPARIMIRVDLDTLLRGVPVGGELCEIVGFGPIPVSVIEELIANDNTFIVGVLTRSHQIQGVYHRRRHPNAYQKSALDFLYPACAVRGCSARAGLQSDHRIDWVKTRFTVFDLLDRLCPHHHRLKTNNGWALVEGTGKRDFVPPGDPRHPDRVALGRHRPP